MESCPVGRRKRWEDAQVPYQSRRGFATRPVGRASIPGALAPVLAHRSEHASPIRRRTASDRLSEHAPKTTHGSPWAERRRYPGSPPPATLRIDFCCRVGVTPSITVTTRNDRTPDPSTQQAPCTVRTTAFSPYWISPESVGYTGIPGLNNAQSLRRANTGRRP